MLNSSTAAGLLRVSVSPSDTDAAQRLFPSLPHLLDRAARHAGDLDWPGAFPVDDIAECARLGLLVAPFPVSAGGLGLGQSAAAPLLTEILRRLGHASLPLGRLYAGHVAAVEQLVRHGSPSQIEAAAADARAGRLFALWDGLDDGVTLERQGNGLRLVGRIAQAAGAGFVARPLVLARDADGAAVMVMPRLDMFMACRADLNGWQAQGLRACAVGAFDLNGLVVECADLLGGPVASERARRAIDWRGAAVVAGGIGRLLDELRQAMAPGRAEARLLPRFGEALLAAETARLWVEATADLAGQGRPFRDAARFDAYAGLAGSAVHKAAAEALALAHRIGRLAAGSGPTERIARDLATWLALEDDEADLATATALWLARAGAASRLRG